MGRRIGRGTKRLRERQRAERVACRTKHDACMKELAERDKRDSEAARVAQVKAAAQAKIDRARAKELTDRLGALGFKIGVIRACALPDLSPRNIYTLDESELERLVAALIERRTPRGGVMRLPRALAPRVGTRPGMIGRFICKLAGHPPGPVWRGVPPDGEGADLRCRACGGVVRQPG